MFNESIIEDELIVDDSDENEDVAPIIYDISSYGADYDVEGLVKRLNRGDIFIPAFQRDYVWNQVEASRLIESLLLGLPVPGVFFAKENDSNKLYVIDGQQRLKSLQFFLNEVFNPKPGDEKINIFRLKHVQERFEGKTYSQLEEEDRINLNDSIIHATIIKQESPVEDNTSIYHVFERLNTGGRKLTAQEIRTAIYAGTFNELLNELNEYPKWRELFGKKNERLKDKEMILRFFAMYEKKKSYEKPLKEFLNKFNAEYRNADVNTIARFRNIFISSIDTIYKYFGPDAFRPFKLFNASVFEVLMVGIALRCALNINFDELAKNIRTLYDHEDFSKTLARSTGNEEIVALRHALFSEFIEKYVEY